MASHKEFQNAGKKPGLQVWRVENFDLKPFPKQLYGNFYTGDAYIVLYTTEAPSYNIHMWLGSECSQDEEGAAAILTTQLDDFLGGCPVQYREVQGYESRAFIRYFKDFGFQYKKGGVASGFQHVMTNDIDVKHLLQVKGRRVARASEVDMSWDSFNKGDCFIIDLGKDIYIWFGSECHWRERQKTTQLAKGIRDNERNGRANAHTIDEGDEPEAVTNVLGPKPDIPSQSCDDKAYEEASKKKASLYSISDAAGSMKTTLISNEAPFKQEMLSPNECYLLDNGPDIIFVWKGLHANTEERKAALKAGQDFIKDKNYPKHTQIQILPGGSETTLFKQFFCNWFDKDEVTGPGKAHTIGRIAKVEQVPFDSSTLHSNKTMAAQHCMVDDGSGKVQIWRVEGNDKAPVDPSTYGQFYGGDCYLVLYTYNKGGREKHIIYTWQGRKCTKDELAASAYLTVSLDDSMGGCPVQVRVTQGQEPPHLVGLFKGNPLVVYMGGTSRKGGHTQAGCTRLFHIRQSSTKATRAVEVEPSAASLNTNDVFVLKTPDALFVWRGAGGTEEEMVAAQYVAKLLGGGNTTSVAEDKEPACFWSALGGKKEYQTSKSLQKTVRTPRLFGCSNKTGRLIAEEVPGDFTQLDLAPDDIMILDTWDQIFLWIGNDANEVERKGAQKIADDYLNTDPSGRRNIPITTIKQGHEPLTFTGWFQAWDSKMWDTDPLEQIKASLQLQSRA